MRRFLCAAALIVVVVLFAACGMIRGETAPLQSATPTGTTSRSEKNDTVKVDETAAKVEIVTANGSCTEPQATAAPQEVETPETGDFPVMYLLGATGLICICSAGLLMLRRI